MCICGVCGVDVLSMCLHVCVCVCVLLMCCLCVCMCVCWLTICVYLRIDPCVHTYAHIHMCAYIYNLCVFTCMSYECVNMSVCAFVFMHT